MERYIKNDLIKWKESKNRKPLLLEGARQVGKTYVLKEFALENYENTIYINFDFDREAKKIFEGTHDPKVILEKLSFLNNKHISPDNTILIFDEIQECPDALLSLKYFCEDYREYSIVSAGSLLGVKLTSKGFPVGKVDFLKLYPMSFTEFLLADGESGLDEYLNKINEIKNLDDVLFEKLNEKLKEYFIIGGMPEVVSSWVTEKNIEEVNKIQSQILKSYENDFSKHADKNMVDKIYLVWKNIVSCLSQEQKEFTASLISKSARKKDFISPIDWLSKTGIIDKIYNIKTFNLPLSAYEDISSFKLYMLDVGLLRKKADLEPKIILEGDNLFKEFKGALTENYVLNMLLSSSKNPDILPNFYKFKNQGEDRKIDFLVQKGNNLVPIEVKSGENKKKRSLTELNEKYNINLSIRFSLRNLKLDGNVLNIPLFMVEYIDKIYDLALEKQILKKMIKKTMY